MGELGSRSFASIWRENLSQADLCLRRREQELLAGLGTVLGRYDREVQCAVLGRVAAELEAQLREERSEVQKRNKLYMTVEHSRRDAIGGAGLLSCWRVTYGCGFDFQNCRHWHSGLPF